MSDTNADPDGDEPSKGELHDRVQQLESTVEKLMPSRRDALRMGAAGIAGAAGLNAASGSADASTGSAGTIGSSSDRPTIFADDIDANSLTGSIKNQGCRVFLSSDQSVSTGSRARIQFDTKSYDSDSNFDTSSHTWTCPETGLYAASLQVDFKSGNSGDERRAFIGRGGTSTPSNEGAREDFASSARFGTTTINRYSSGDVIVAYAENINSNDTLRGGNESFATFLEVTFLGGL